MTPDEIKAKAKEIKHTAAGRVLFEYLQLRKNETTAQMVATKDIAALRNLQGRAQELDELLKLISEKTK